jgi:hypothetical protein
MQAPYLYVVATLMRIEFVWRQLGFAFFGALTPVGAPFYILGGKLWRI